MVKKGEYFEYALELEKKLIDYIPLSLVKENELVFGTNIAMIVEIAKKVKDLELRIKKLEEVNDK